MSTLINKADLINEIMVKCNNMTSAYDVLKVISKHQTDYDVDKVVEQLEDYSIEFETFGQCSDYVELSHAIEIVKKGGKE
jgi:putative IMPACT (imprinted ancient) family translation regulator